MFDQLCKEADGLGLKGMLFRVWKSDVFEDIPGASSAFGFG